MARVTVEESQRIINISRGIRMFNFEVGRIYHVLFLGEKVGETPEGLPLEEPILYMNPTHNVRKGNKGFEARCANEKFNISNVVLKDDKGQLMVDPRTGTPLNDGTCPYCELQKLFSKVAFKKREDWIAENPEASKKEIKEYTRKLFENAPVQQPSQARVFLVAVFELDAKGRVMADSEGNKLYNIMGMKMSEHRFDNKFLEQVEIKRMSLEEHDKGIAWHEYYFKFPKNDQNSKMLSGKDLNVSAVPNPVLQSDPGLKEELIKKIEEIDLDELEEQIFVYKLKTLDEMNKDIAPLMSKVKENMTDEEIEQLKEELGEDSTVDDEEVKEIMGEDIKKEVKTENKVDTTSGESAFNVEVTEEDIESLM